MYRTIGSTSDSPGVYVDYSDSLSMTVRQLHELGVLPSSNDTQHLKLIIKDGMDGASHQLKMKGAEYPSMELFGYVLLEAYDISTPVSYVLNKAVNVVRTFINNTCKYI